MSELCPTGRSEGYGACDDARGRTFAKKQAAKWAERKRQVKNRAVQSDRPPQVKPQATAKVPRQVETAVNTVDTPVKMAKRPA